MSRQLPPAPSEIADTKEQAASGQSPRCQEWPHLWLADSPLFVRHPMEVGWPAPIDRLPRIDAIARHLSRFVGK